MAVCSICGEIFDNVSGSCPNCGTAYAPSTSGRTAEQIYQEAMERIRAGQVIDAKGLLSQAIEMEPTNGAYRFYLGSAYYKLGEYEDAYSTWQKADRLMPNTDRILKGLVAARQRISEKDNKKKP